MEYGSSTEPEGRYANSLHVGFNVAEFVLDFGQYYPDSPGPEFCVRIVTAPAYARAFADVLEASLGE